jgi:hypothetical protein
MTFTLVLPHRSFLEKVFPLYFPVVVSPLEGEERCEADGSVKATTLISFCGDILRAGDDEGEAGA